MQTQKISSIVNSTIPPLSIDASIILALSTMQKNHISSVIIVDNKQKPIGIFTEKDSLKVIANTQEKTSTLEEVMTKNVFCVPESSYIHDAYVLMEEKEYRHLVVVDEDGLYIGVVTEGDFLRHMGFEDIIYEKIISEAMSESILTITNEATILETAKQMTKKNCDYAIIVNDNQPTGIITERDISLYCTSNPIDAFTKVSILHHHEMYTIDKHKTLQEASSLMQKHSVHQLIVLNEEQELVGLLTRHDILKTIHGAYFDFLLKTIDEKTDKEFVLKEQAKELKKLANFDMLTQLPNRLLFEKLLKKSVANAIRNKYATVLIIFDIDRFKDINDSYGHKIGDELLVSIATRFSQQIREGDVTARLGGNEFALILEHVASEDIIPKMLSKILKAVSEPIHLSNSTDVSVEACAGVVVIPRDSQDAEQIIQFANSALHQAKKEGHGVYKFYTTEFLDNALEKIAYENALRLALENNELELYYQPQVHIQTNKIISTEALIRWKTKDGKMIPPNIFIPIAEETGLINEVGKWVINEACRQGKIWLDKGYNLTIAINISANQVKYQDLATLISEALHQHNYDPHKLEIELTESALMQREDEVSKMLYSLRAQGIKLAIDDFGTGYSSLAYLKHFPIDVLKIDKSFIDDTPYEKDDCAIVTAIIEMGKALGYVVLAEGIEQQEQLDFLKQRGCNLYQGYLRSRALPAKEFEELLEKQNA